MNRSEEIRKLTGLSRAAFCRKYNIPIRTVEEWDAGRMTPPDYLLELLERAVREDMGLPRLYYVYTCMNDGSEEWIREKTYNKHEAIEAAREAEYRLFDQKDKYYIEIRLYVEDIEDEECTCFDYDTIPFDKKEED